MSLGCPTFLPAFTLELISRFYSIYRPSPGTRGLEKHLSFIWNPPWLSRKAETVHKHMQSIKEAGNKKTQTRQCWDFSSVSGGLCSLRHHPADSQVGQCWVLSAWVRQGRAQNICFQEIMEYFGGITWLHLEYLWRYLKNLLLKAQLISKPGLVAQGLVLSSMDIFPRMDVFPKDGDTLSSSTAPWPVWPRQPKPFVTWPGPAPRVPHIPLAGWGTCVCPWAWQGWGRSDGEHGAGSL